MDFFQIAATSDVPRARIATKTVAEFMWESGVDGMGLIKVDAEETEYEVLSEFDLALLGKVNGILGVFHGETSLDGSHNCVMVRKFY